MFDESQLSVAILWVLVTRIHYFGFVLLSLPTYFLLVFHRFYSGPFFSSFLLCFFSTQKVAFADLKDDMDLAEDYLKYLVAYALGHCQVLWKFF